MITSTEHCAVVRVVPPPAAATIRINMTAACGVVQVYKGRRRATGQITAMKFIVKHGKSAKDIRSLRQEIEILRTLKHENIIQMLDTFETADEFCVVTEFAQGAVVVTYAPSERSPALRHALGSTKSSSLCRPVYS
jgi:serine/threonine protein kinase